MIDLLLQLI